MKVGLSLACIGILVLALVLTACSRTAAEYRPVIAAGSGHTVGLKSDGTVVAAGPEVELAKWDLF